jgi:hypothetical protein
VSSAGVTRDWPRTHLHSFYISIDVYRAGAARRLTYPRRQATKIWTRLPRRRPGIVCCGPRADARPVCDPELLTRGLGCNAAIRRRRHGAPARRRRACR